jgi:hypothetical protein
MTAWTEYYEGAGLHPHEAIDGALHALLTHGDTVDAGHWQGYETEGRPDLVTKEIVNLTFTAQIPHTIPELHREVMPNMPWAEAHFLERVSRVPSNPGEEYQRWPHWQGQVAAFDANVAVHATTEHGTSYYRELFSHTYQERFWPKYADLYTGGELPAEGPHFTDPVRKGIRYDYGDLDDVVRLLRAHPHTRQATFPIFFPEDTGAVHGGRIPCTLHYHFLLRNQRLHMWYPIRSCDAYRHFRDDIYMAMRLNHWVLEQLRATEYDAHEVADMANASDVEVMRAMDDAPGYMWRDVKPGVLCFTAYSFHVHMGDLHKLTIQP